MKFNEKRSSYNDLTLIEKQRFASLRSFYEEDEDIILEIILNLEPRGENSWKKTYDKIAAIGRSDYKQQIYHDALYDNFIIGQIYEPSDVIKIVVSVMHDMDLPPYLTGLKKNCEKDLFSLFIIETIFKDDTSIDSNTIKSKKVITGYKPIVRLKPNED